MKTNKLSKKGATLLSMIILAFVVTIITTLLSYYLECIKPGKSATIKDYVSNDYKKESDIIAKRQKLINSIPLYYSYLSGAAATKYEVEERDYVRRAKAEGISRSNLIRLYKDSGCYRFINEKGEEGLIIVDNFIPKDEEKLFR